MEVSVLQKTNEDDNAKRSCPTVSYKLIELRQNIPALRHMLKRLSWLESSHVYKHFQIS